MDQAQKVESEPERIARVNREFEEELSRPAGSEPERIARVNREFEEELQRPVKGNMKGVFSVVFEVGDLSGERFVSVKALVDTGSSDTSLPQDLADELGIVADGERRYREADERIVTYPIGQVRVRLEGQERVVTVAFAPVGIPPLLGASTLETFGLGVDPNGLRLISTTGPIHTRPGS